MTVISGPTSRLTVPSGAIDTWTERCRYDGWMNGIATVVPDDSVALPKLRRFPEGGHRHDGTGHHLLIVPKHFQELRSQERGSFCIYSLAASPGAFPGGSTDIPCPPRKRGPTSDIRRGNAPRAACIKPRQPVHTDHIKRREGSEMDEQMFCFQCEQAAHCSACPKLSAT